MLVGFAVGILTGFVTGILVGRNNKKRVERYVSTIKDLGENAPESLKNLI